MTGALGTMVCPLEAKKSKKEALISREVMTFTVIYNECCKNTVFFESLDWMWIADYTLCMGVLIMVRTKRDFSLLALKYSAIP